MTRRAYLHDPQDVPKELRKATRAKKSSWLPMLYRNGKFYRVDFRSREGRLLRDTRDALLESLNRKPSPAEKILIERLAWLHLCVQCLDSKVLAGEVSYDESVQYSSHINSFSKGLANLGLLGSALALPALDASQTATVPVPEIPPQDAHRSLRKRERVEVEVE